MRKKLFFGLVVLAVAMVFAGCPAEPAVTYTVTYNTNNADSGTAPVAQTKTQGIDLILSSNSGSLLRTGYTFTGWNTSDDGSGTDYAEGATYTTDSDETLYAKWISQFAGTWINAAYNGQGGTPSAKLEIDNDGTYWVGYDNVTDTTSIGTTTVTFEGAFEGDTSWIKFKDSNFRVLKVDGSTLYFNLDFVSYQAAYDGTEGMDYTYTKQ